jgi:hypothetical protein
VEARCPSDRHFFLKPPAHMLIKKQPLRG